MRMIATTSTVIWFNIFLVSSLPTRTKIKQEEIVSLVDLKFVNLDKLLSMTSTETSKELQQPTTTPASTASSTVTPTTTSTTTSKIKRNEILSLVDHKFVNLNRSIILTTTSATTESNKCDCLVTSSSLSRVKRYVGGGLPVYSRGLPVIVIKSPAYDEYLQSQKYPNSPPTNSIVDPGSENDDMVPFNPIQMYPNKPPAIEAVEVEGSENGSENDDMVPFNPIQMYPNTPPTNTIEGSENGLEHNDNVPFKCDCSEDAENKRGVNDVNNFVGPIGRE